MVELTGRSLTLAQVEAVARRHEPVRLAPEARDRVARGRQVVDSLDPSRAYYGINTGVGRLADRVIPPEEVRQLQVNIVRSHAVGVGPELAADQVRAAMLLRANSLASGYSGVRPEVLEHLLALLNHDILPVVPSRGSVGASGDLAPLAHIALALIGEGEVWFQGERRPAAEALQQVGLRPLTLEAKEGLALINGTQVSTAVLALALLDARRLLHWAHAIAALTFVALRGIPRAFDPIVFDLRPHPGARRAAEALRTWLQGARYTPRHPVQDAYSLRCIPQIHGAVADALDYVERVVSVEINAVTDNPLVLPEGEVLSCGNFHGQPVAFAADHLATVLVALAGLSERRTFRLMDPDLSGLPAFLTPAGGVNSGFMMLQVTQAALVSESKALAHPASVDSLPTSANQEDYVSMSMAAALKAWQVLDHTREVLGIELLAALQALDLLEAEGVPPRIRALHQALRQHLAPVHEDRVLQPDLATVRRILREHSVQDFVA